MRCGKFLLESQIDTKLATIIENFKQKKILKETIFIRFFKNPKETIHWEEWIIPIRTKRVAMPQLVRPPPDKNPYVIPELDALQKSQNTQKVAKVILDELSNLEQAIQNATLKISIESCAEEVPEAYEGMDCYRFEIIAQETDQIERE